MVASYAQLASFLAGRERDVTPTASCEPPLAVGTRRRVLAGIATTMFACSGCLASGGRSLETVKQYSAGMVTVDHGPACFGTIEDIYAIDIETGDSVWTYQDAYEEIDQLPSVTMEIGVQTSQLGLLEEVSNRQEITNDLAAPGCA